MTINDVQQHNDCDDTQQCQHYVAADQKRNKNTLIVNCMLASSVKLSYQYQF